MGTLRVNLIILHLHDLVWGAAGGYPSCDWRSTPSTRQQYIKTATLITSCHLKVEYDFVKQAA